jgi:hypothetical protein
MRHVEPPSSQSHHRSPLFLIGRNSRGNWVVRDPSGRRGGLFIDRAEALRFALFENGHRPQAVIMVPDVLELDLNADQSATPAANSEPAREHLVGARAA